MLLRQKVYYYTDRQKALHSEGTHNLLHMRRDKTMDNENKTNSLKNNWYRYPAAIYPTFPALMVSRSARFAAQQMFNTHTTTLETMGTVR